MSERSVRIVTCTDVPDHAEPGVIYRLVPTNASDAYYRERTDRNIGWLAPDEQQMLHTSVVGVAGCGGMGGLIAATLVRAGVGEVRIADCEEFDTSNINRQFGAGRTTVGKSKALETARMIRAISDDVPLVIYPQGITEDTVEHFLYGCDLVSDEIEFFSIGARVLLHIRAREQRIPLLNCDTVGHSTFCFKFTHDSMTLEEVLGFNYEKATQLEHAIRTRAGTEAEQQATRDHIIEVILRAFVPTLPEYGVPGGTYSTKDAFMERLTREGRASIIASNPPMATGFMANRIITELVYARSARARMFEPLPSMPGYLAFDAVHMKATSHTGVWW